MDSTPDATRMDVEEDRLSVLQDDLILKILSFMDVKDAMKTSVLSSKWRYVWTSLPHLNFSIEDFSIMDKFYNFVKHVLSRRNNQAQLSSVNLYLRSKYGLDVSERTMNHAFSFNVQHVNLACLSKKNIGFCLSISGSRTHKHLTFHRPFGYSHIRLTSTPELSSLTTLHLDCITFYDGFFSKCPNLENLTLKCCNMARSEVLRICHPRLSNLTLDNGDMLPDTINVVTPQLKSLTITQLYGKYVISAPDLASLFFRGYCPFKFSTDGFHSLEKAQLSLHSLRSSQAPDIISLLQKLHNVKVLSLSMEIIQVLNSSVELVSHLRSPLANLESLKILPKVYCLLRHKHTRVIMSDVVKNYLLNRSPKATLTEVLQKQCCDITAGAVPCFV